MTIVKYVEEEYERIGGGFGWIKCHIVPVIVLKPKIFPSTEERSNITVTGSWIAWPTRKMRIWG